VFWLPSRSHEAQLRQGLWSCFCNGRFNSSSVKLFNQWDLFGWHRVTVFGDLKEPLIEFGKALGLSIVEEA
jgi:hypothetical protein